MHGMAGRCSTRSAQDVSIAEHNTSMPSLGCMHALRHATASQPRAALTEGGVEDTLGVPHRLLARLVHLRPARELHAVGQDKDMKQGHLGGRSCGRAAALWAGSACSERRNRRGRERATHNPGWA